MILKFIFLLIIGREFFPPFFCAHYSTVVFKTKLFIMKIDWSTFLTFLLALIAFRFIDKLLLNKVDSMFGFEEYERE